jgi:uncharacterized protein
MKIVLDTNVLVSGLLNPNGTPAAILGLFINGKIRLVIDNRILTEYADVLYRKKFQFRPEWIEPLIDYIRNESEFIIANPVSKPFKDEDDKKFYEVLKTANAVCLITGNINHYPKEKIIKTPKAFLDFYLSGNSE